MNNDLQHLRWLTTGFYVYAALTALFACFPLIHVAIGIAMITGTLDEGKNPPPPAFGWMFAGMGAFFIILGWTLAVCVFLVGKYIKERRRYIFCLVIAGICCMFAPLGTVLGVFTFVVLLRDSVKPLFNGETVKQNLPPVLM